MRPFLFVVLALAVGGCVGSRTGGRGTENPYWQERAFAAAPDVVYRAALEKAREQGWGLRARDRPLNGGLEFVAVTPGRGSQWEDTVSVTVAATDEGSRVIVRTGIASGPDRPEVHDYLAALIARLEPGRP